jgi:hypothetical protein
MRTSATHSCGTAGDRYDVVGGHASRLLHRRA